jgi:hypothetical protein
MRVCEDAIISDAIQEKYKKLATHKLAKVKVVAYSIKWSRTAP